jgi:hypothetical protein
VRDVRDVVLSEYAHWKWTGVEVEGFDDFLIRFLKGRTHGFGFGSWVTHVNSWLDACSIPGNEIFIVRYEDMCQNTEEVLSRVIDFLGVDVAQQVIRDAIDNNSLARMRKKEDEVRHTVFKNKPEGVRFVREGRVGGWRQKLTDGQVQLIHQYTGQTLRRLGYVV